MATSEDISASAIVTDSSIGERVKIYRNAEIRNSKLGAHVSVGDQTIILRSDIKSNVALNRRNYILRTEIGSYTYTGIGTMALSATIGRFCSIAWNVSIGGADHEYQNVTTSPLWRFHVMDSGSRVSEVDYDNQAKCCIGNDVWIASNAVILRNLSIGNGAVIGAGAVVTKDVEPYTIVAGAPARVIKKRFDERTIEALKEIEWWNWPIKTLRENLELIYCSTVNEGVLQKLKQIAVNIEDLVR